MMQAPSKIGNSYSSTLDDEQITQMFLVGEFAFLVAVSDIV